jgi:hypothetical protein
VGWAGLGWVRLHATNQPTMEVSHMTERRLSLMRARPRTEIPTRRCTCTGLDGPGDMGRTLREVGSEW